MHGLAEDFGDEAVGIDLVDRVAARPQAPPVARPRASRRRWWTWSARGSSTVPRRFGARRVAAIGFADRIIMRFGDGEDSCDFGDRQRLARARAREPPAASVRRRLSDGIGMPRRARLRAAARFARSVPAVSSAFGRLPRRWRRRGFRSRRSASALDLRLGRVVDDVDFAWSCG